MKWKNAYVFISSTFNDMHAERDYLTKNVFPELSEWCANYKIRLVDIDLRWGITQQDSIENKRTVDICLDNIDKCRPFFLCFLGQRRGWIPAKEDISSETFEKFTGLDYAVNNSMSVTEMEIYHAIFSPFSDLPKTEHSFFCFRDPSYLNEIKNCNPRLIEEGVFVNKNPEDDIQLQNFKQKICSSCKNIINYSAQWDSNLTTPEIVIKDDFDNEIKILKQGRLKNFKETVSDRKLKDVIIDCFKKAISTSEDFSERFVTKQERCVNNDLQQQEEYLHLASENYIETDNEYDQLWDYINDDSNNSAFLICSEQGVGKTAYIANFISKQLENSENYSVFYRFIGQSELSNTVDELKESFINEINEKNARDIKINIHYLLMHLHTLSQSKKIDSSDIKTILFIDGIEKLKNPREEFYWLFKNLPDNVKVIFSLTIDKNTEKSQNSEIFYDSNIKTLVLKPFSEEKIRVFLEEFFGTFLKKLDDNSIKTIAKNTVFENPTLLKLFVNEMRLFGSFDNLENKISEYPKTIREAFLSLIEKILKETDEFFDIDNSLAVISLLHALATSRRGLKMEQLIYVCDKIFNQKNHPNFDSFGFVMHLIRRLRGFLSNKSGLVSFSSDIYKNIILDRYVHFENFSKPALCLAFSQDIGKKNSLAFCSNANKFSLTEYPYHLSVFKQELLADLLQNYKFLYWKTQKCGIDSVIRDFSYLEDIDNFPILVQNKEALQKASHVLREHPEQFFFQFFQEIDDSVEKSVYSKMRDDARELMTGFFIEPVSRTKNPIGYEKKIKLPEGVYLNNSIFSSWGENSLAWHSDTKTTVLFLDDLSIKRFVTPKGITKCFAAQKTYTYDSKNKLLYIKAFVDEKKEAQIKWQYSHECVQDIGKNIVVTTWQGGIRTELVKVFKESLYFVVEDGCSNSQNQNYRLVVYDDKKDECFIVFESDKKIIDFFVDKKQYVVLFYDNTAFFSNGSQLKLESLEKIVCLKDNNVFLIKDEPKGSHVLKIKNISSGELIFEQKILGTEMKVANGFLYFNTPTAICEVDLSDFSETHIKHWLEPREPFGSIDYTKINHTRFLIYNGVLITKTFDHVSFFDLSRKVMLAPPNYVVENLTFPLVCLNNKLYASVKNKKEIAVVDFSSIKNWESVLDSKTNNEVKLLEKDFWINEKQSQLTCVKYSGEVIKSYKKSASVTLVSNCVCHNGVLAFITERQTKDKTESFLIVDKGFGNKENTHIETLRLDFDDSCDSLEMISDDCFAVVYSKRVNLINISTKAVIRDILSHSYAFDGDNLYAVKIYREFVPRIKCVKKLGKYLLCIGDSYSKSYIWDTEKMEEICELPLINEELSTNDIPYLVVNDNEKQFAIIYNLYSLDSIVRIYHLADKNIEMASEIVFKSKVTAFAQSDEYIFLAFNSNELKVFDINSWECIYSVNTQGDVKSMSYDNNILCASVNNRVYTYKVIN